MQFVQRLISLLYFCIWYSWKILLLPYLSCFYPLHFVSLDPDRCQIQILNLFHILNLPGLIVYCVAIVGNAENEHNWMVLWWIRTVAIITDRLNAPRVPAQRKGRRWQIEWEEFNKARCMSGRNIPRVKPTKTWKTSLWRSSMDGTE